VPRALIAGAILAAAGHVLAADPAEWKVEGRPLPLREFLQPALDAELPAYRSAGVAGKLEGSAPPILARLARRWVAAFREREPAVRVDVPPPYEEPRGAGSERLRLFLDGRIDFAFLTRDLTAPDVAAFRRVHGFDPLQIAVAGGSFRHFGFVDAVAVVVHRDNPVRGLTLAQLDAIFSKTRHRGQARAAVTWGDVGVGEWADRPIHVVGHGAWSGEESARATFIRRNVMDAGARRGEWRDFGLPDGGDAIVGDAVAADRYAIGFTGMGHLAPGIRTVALAPAAGAPFYEADYDNVARADYPLSRVLYLVVARKPGEPLAPALEAFAKFLLSRDGQREVLEQGIFLPLRARQAADALGSLNAR
jgi:phosphate transport system substrate-binding protein